jgi:hypothetical protein
LKYTAILFLFFCEFTFGQIPGNPNIISTREFPTVYTLSYVNLGDVTLEVTAQVINTGLYPVTTTGILWGTSQPTITNFFGKTEDGNILGQPFTSIASPLPDDASVYVVAYATTAAGTFYGKVLTARTGVVRSPYTGKVWMDMNLGASDVPKAQQLDSDTASFGHLYQWGRKADGHQIVLPLRADGGTAASYDINGKPLTGTFFSQTIARPQNTNILNAPANKFITTPRPPSETNGNWLSAPFDEIWQGINGYNVPCPSGFRVPYAGEFMDEVNNTFPSKNITGAFNSFLRLPVTGYRENLDGKPARYFSFNEGRYWTADYIGTDQPTATAIIINRTTIIQTDDQYMSVNTTQRDDANRSRGYAVRCIKGEYPSGGTAYPDSVSTINSSSTGNLVAGEPASGVTQTVFAYVKTQGGSYDISTFRNNGIIFSGKGTLAANTNNQPITLTASGTPLQGTPPGSPITFTHSSFSFSFSRSVSGASSNGTAEVNSYTNVSSTGIMLRGYPILVGDVSQTITADVSIPGKYNIQAVNNGVTFSASGTFTGTGNQEITLTASGTPANTEQSGSFTTNTTPSVTFTRTTIDESSNGTAVISAINSSTRSGTITVASPVSGVAETLSVNVTKNGSYSLTTTNNNGLTFSGSGSSLGGINTRSIILTGSGTPIALGNFDFITNTIPSFTFSRTTVVNPSSRGTAVVSGYTTGTSTGTMLKGFAVSGVSQKMIADVTTVGTYSIGTAAANGVTFAGSGTFTGTGNQEVTLTASGTPLNTAAGTIFTLNTSTASRTFTRTTIDQSTNGTAILTYNSSAPAGTMNMLNPTSATQLLSVNVGVDGSYSVTTTTNNGVTFSGSGSAFGGINTRSMTLTASGTPIEVGDFNFITNTIPAFTFTRTTAGHLSSRGTAIVSEYTNGTSAGTMFKGVAVSGVSQTMIANVTKEGSYSISTTPAQNGVIFAASGTFTGTGNQEITLTASGTPTSRVPSTTFTLNTTPNTTFTRTTIEPSSNGIAIVTGYQNGAYSGGTMTAGVLIAGTFTQIVKAAVSGTGGAYNISTTNNGVTFSGSGSVASGGTRDIPLTASGTPIAPGTYNFTLNTNPTTTFSITFN